MLYPESKEREERFKLALRMGLPIFFLTVLLTFMGLSQYFNRIPDSFFILAIAILAVMIYFIFYLIYIGMEERITDPVTHTFTREYMTNLVKKEIEKAPYTVLLLTVDNIHDINERYSPVNGDKVLREFSRIIGEFFDEKGIDRVPVGHYKGGDFLIGLPGEKQTYLSIFSLLCIKTENLTIDDIEIKISGAIVDTTLTKDTEQLITRLFDLQQINKIDRESGEDEDETNPTELENDVIEAIRSQRISVQFQPAEEHGNSAIVESTVKLISGDGKLIHQKNYIPVINRLGLSRELDTLLVDKVMEISAKAQLPLIYAINIFPSTARNQRFFDHVHRLMVDNVAMKGHIVFVLGEQEYFNKIAQYNDLLQSYRRMGVLIALDRYGSYQTTMHYLRHLKVDIVRFDNSFGKHIDDDGVRAILKGLNLGAQMLGVKTWIRMIEDESAKKVCDQIGISFIQGNHIGRIAPIEALEIG